LLIPAAPSRQEQVLTIPIRASAISDAIGGGLIDDVVYGSVEGEGFCLYVDEEREAKTLPHNTRALMVAAGLGCLDDARRVRLRGDVLVTGVDEYGNDRDVPLAVVLAVRVVRLVTCRFQDRSLDRDTT
jgi:hypothetical protein